MVGVVLCSKFGGGDGRRDFAGSSQRRSSLSSLPPSLLPLMFSMVLFHVVGSVFDGFGQKRLKKCFEKVSLINDAVVN